MESLSSKLFELSICLNMASTMGFGEAP